MSHGQNLSSTLKESEFVRSEVQASVPHCVLALWSSADRGIAQPNQLTISFTQNKSAAGSADLLSTGALLVLSDDNGLVKDGSVGLPQGGPDVRGHATAFLIADQVVHILIL